MYDFSDKYDNYDRLLYAIQIKNPNYKKEDSMQMTEAEIFADYAKYSNKKEKQVLDFILSNQIEVPVISEKDARYMPLLSATNFIFPLDDEGWFVDIDFINNYNQYVLNSQYKPLPQLDDDEEDAILEMQELHEARQEYGLYHLPFRLCDFTVKELKQICRNFKIKGFSKCNSDELIELIEDAFMEDPFERFDYLTEDARSLIAYFIVEGSNVIPFTHVSNLDLDVFMVAADWDYSVLYMPIDIFEFLVDYFEQNNIDPLDYIDPDDREILEEINKMQKLNALTSEMPKNIEGAIAAFSEAGQDEDMREVVKELLAFEDDGSDDAKVMNAILDGKITSQDELDQFLSELHDDAPKQPKRHKKNKSNHPSQSNIIDFNQYRK
ncbi:hypothetical protein [Staphylococcus simulans]|uniref:hypothetical protein n=1 Tax=Staphylococcus simulans TaxID=1286 RepID=UPI003F7F811F